MNSIQFAIFIKKTFAARHVPAESEWRFRNGDNFYSLSIRYEDNRSTYEPHVSQLGLRRRLVEEANEDARYVKTRFIASLDKDRMTKEDARNWILKAIISDEFA